MGHFDLIQYQRLLEKDLIARQSLQDNPGQEFEHPEERHVWYVHLYQY